MADEEEAPALVPQRDIAAMPQESNDAPLLDRKALAALLGVTYGQLREMADVEGVRRWAGAVAAQKGRGERYGPEAAQKMRHLMEARRAGLVSPKTVEAWIANMDPGSAAALVPRSSNAAMLQTLTDALREHSQALRDNTRALPPPEDKLLHADEAAELLGVSPSTLRKLLPPVKVGRLSRWRRSDVLRLIQNL